ncbi:hypothetical protein SAMN04487783_2499 [Agrococcus baldri]|uniref:Sodium:proton antiporter n=1 Tax=Agrococcus baldri TaxID=153730 RepID=A0AA94HQA0_9MICO|nr:DUF6328 family protein [Agrococcus baldri]SFS18047.1 hypothetical protein SAMN04487783_2499 [Agrococcus baldri]
MNDSRGRDETPEERADRNFADILQELRVVLTGTQLISGFLLAVAFQSGFKDLDADEIVHYLVLVAIAGLATLLGMTPVVVHRLHFAKRMKADVVQLGNRFLIATLVVVSALVVGVTSFIFEVVLSAAAGIWAAGVTLAVLVALWTIAWIARRRAPARE